jgi:hypothetical protein
VSRPCDDVFVETVGANVSYCSVINGEYLRFLYNGPFQFVRQDDDGGGAGGIGVAQSRDWIGQGFIPLVMLPDMCCFRQDPRYCLSESAIDWEVLQSVGFKNAFKAGCQAFHGTSYNDKLGENFFEMYMATINASLCSGTTGYRAKDNGCGTIYYPGFCDKVAAAEVPDDSPIDAAAKIKYAKHATDLIKQGQDKLASSPGYAQLYYAFEQLGVSITKTMEEAQAGASKPLLFYPDGRPAASGAGGSLPSSMPGSAPASGAFAIDFWSWVPGSPVCTFITSEDMRGIGTLMYIGLVVTVLHRIWINVVRASKII